jgi:ATP-binding cassette subfamily F protein uup
MADTPQLMLLDEPTNHLDIEAIGWLEAELKSTRAAYVLISHDRRFLGELTRATLWVDRGQVRRQETGFDGFEAWRDKIWDEEDQSRHKLNRKIKSEARWAVEGISARRKRNQGRVRALQDLRAERAGMLRRQGTAAMDLAAGPKSGKKVIEAEGITKAFGDKPILRAFDLKVQRGDRVAFVGPNGVGKTTLIRMLTGEIEPDEGKVSLGTNLAMAVFDQTRAQLDPDMTLWDSLTGDPEMRVSGKADQIMVRGMPKHVVGYLKEFLFDDAQARAPVRSLSGGEKARLLLAKIMARESNLLVLDEPTNDLDVETLDLLQDILGDYPGTVLLVSHDRDFIDRVATTTVAMEGDGNATIYAGGWSDYQAQKVGAGAGGASGSAKQKAKAAKATSAPAKPAPKRISFTEKHRLEELPKVMERLEAEIAKLEGYLAAPDLFTAEPVKFKKATEALTERQQALAAAEEEWLALAEKAEG